MKAQRMIPFGIGMLLVGLVVAQASAANFSYSVQFTGSDTGTATLGPGQHLTFNVYANVLAAGADANISGYSFGIFGLNSVSAGNGNLQGTMAFAWASAWNNGQTGISQGTQQRIDSDGDFDWGGTDGNLGASGWIVLNYGNQGFKAGTQVLLGSGSFTVQDPNGYLGETTNLNVLIANRTIGSASSKLYDTFALNSGDPNTALVASQTSMAGNSSLLTVGTPILVTFVPEPVTIGLLIAGASGLLALRRRKTA